MLAPFTQRQPNVVEAPQRLESDLVGLFGTVAASALGSGHVVAVVDPPHERHDLVFVEGRPRVGEIVVGEGDGARGDGADQAIAELVCRTTQICGSGGLEAALDGRAGEAEGAGEAGQTEGHGGGVC